VLDCSQTNPCLTLSFAVRLLGNTTLYIMECAWTTIPFSVGGNYLTLSTTNEINPQASIAWSGSGSVPLFSVVEGQLTFKY
jgi:hypothetical protein